MIGRQVLRTAAERKLQVIATSRTKPGYLPAIAHWHCWDLTEKKSEAELDVLLNGVDAIIHLGAAVISPTVEISDDTLMEVNVSAVERLARWARKRDIPFLFLSSATVYADVTRAGILESDKKTDRKGLGGYYGYSKLLAEQALLDEKSSGLRTCILRPSSIYGSGLQSRKMIPRFLRQALQGETIQLAPPTVHRVDLLHSSDVATALFAVVEQESWGIFNIASENPVSIREIAEECINVAGQGQIELPQEESIGVIPTRFALNCDAARAAFSFVAQMRLREGLLEMLRNNRSS
jgi:nucleoside-diphosphate-sugar epimerase